MKTITYNKLVRDKIPQIIERSGSSCICSTLTGDEYKEALDKKLLEEVGEYLKSGAVEELADIEEVLRAILDYKNVGIEEFNKIRLKKLDERGGFSGRIFLKEVTEK